VPAHHSASSGGCVTKALEQPAPSEDITRAPDRPTVVVRYVRSPRDVLRLVAFLAAAFFLVTVAHFGEDAVLGFEEDLIRLLSFLPPVFERILSGVVQVLGAVALLAGIAIPIKQRSPRILGYVALAGLSAVLVMWLVETLLTRVPPPVVVNQLARRAGITHEGFPDVEGLAMIAAVFVVLSVFASRRWRRAGWVLAGVIILLELMLSLHLPVSMFAALAIGGAMGAGVLVAFGRPDQRPTLESVSDALRAAGLPVTALKAASVDARGSTPYLATSNGRGIFVKVLGADERSADLLFRIYRWVRLKNVGDERPFSSLRRTVEHEAFVSLLARDAGVKTPRLRAAAAVGDDAMLLAYDLIDGRSLDSFEDEISDGLLDDVWEQAAILRRCGIAHRDLRRANVFVDNNHECWVIDFGFSEAAAAPQLLNNDVAQLLASLTVQVGAQRSVDSAVRVLGTEAVADALPRLQLNALSGATRAALKQRKGLLEQLQREVADRTGVEEIHIEDLTRINPRTIFTIVILAAVTYLLVPQLTDLPGIVARVKAADWAWLAPLILASALSYVGAGVSILGAVANRVPVVPTFIAQIASSFASKLAPAAVGGMALNVRYLEKSGVDAAAAATGVGLNTVVGLIVHISMLMLFLVWAGRSAFGSISFPNPRHLLYGLAAVVVLAIISLAVPAVRQILRGKAWPIIKRAAKSLASVARRPDKLALLAGGSFIVTMSYILAVFFAVRAFGAHLAFPKVGVIYVLGATVATVAPTPGGLGAMEAALISGFAAAGVPHAIGVPSVFLYRLATFWLPILPGWLCFRWLKRNDYL
jgi:uncharacterized protein (TIRG00374 family)